MRRLFIQFYLLLLACFIGALLVFGSIYTAVVSDFGEQYLNDIIRANMNLIESELHGLPLDEWNETLSSLHRTYPVKVESLDSWVLAPEDAQVLHSGDVLMLEDRDLFLMKIPDSNSVLAFGPLKYLGFIRQVEWYGWILLLALGGFLGVPAYLWMRPMWRQLEQLESVSLQLAAGKLQARTRFPSGATLEHLGNTVNGMGEAIQKLLSSKQALIDAISHELRTPIARLRYRLAAVADQPELAAQVTAMERDVAVLDHLVEELLLYSRLDHSGMQLNKTCFEILPWLQGLIDDALDGGGQVAITLLWNGVDPKPLVTADRHYLARAVSNLLRNASRYARQRVELQLAVGELGVTLLCDDDGEGVAEADRERIFEPFVRLDQSRGRQTGGHGLGLAIVKAIVDLHGGHVGCEQSDLGGARFRIDLPRG